jgi:class 3 adenylate cyclase
VSETRKLAAILVSDVVGYSRLAGADEDRILARLRALRSDLIDPTIAVHHGRVVKRTPHGWRSCFRDWCGDLGDVPRDLAEAALAHSLNAAEGAYRRMTAVERRREVMTRYADWLNDERGKVLAFPTGKTV